MKTPKYLWALLCLISGATLMSCNDSKSYADRLLDENKAINLYLSDQRVILDIPADTIFEYGPDAPFYRMDADGNVFMQVISPGDRKNNRATEDQLLYFRFTRWSLLYNYYYGEMLPDGNADNMEYTATSFRFGNTTLPSSTTYGSGIQLPLYYLGIDCEVNLIVKAAYGFSSDQSNVNPYLYNLRYFPPMSN